MRCYAEKRGSGMGEGETRTMVRAGERMSNRLRVRVLRRWGTVAEGKARLRAIVTATHKRADLEKAADILAEVGRGLGIV